MKWLRLLMLPLTVVASGLLLAPVATANLRNPGPTFSTGWNSSCSYTRSAQVDPIFNPGTPSMHLHDFFGTTPDENSTYQSLQAGGTTCVLKDDTAGYWAPSLYTLDVNGLPVQRPPIDATIYYFGPPTWAPATVHAFPPNLKMRAGDPESTSPQATNRVWWDCRDTGTYSARSSVPYLCRPGALVRSHILFPTCWDGTAPSAVGDDSAHMSYPIHVTCPVGTVRVPLIQLEITYAITDGTNARLSSGTGLNDPTSIYSLHADFFNAWNPTVHDQLVQGCLNDVVPANCSTPTTPSIDRAVPATAPAGAAVVIGGFHFTGVKSVTFNGKPAAFTVTNNVYLTAIVPSGATSGPISVTTDGGTGTAMLTTGYSPFTFVVT